MFIHMPSVYSQIVTTNTTYNYGFLTVPEALTYSSPLFSPR